MRRKKLVIAKLSYGSRAKWELRNYDRRCSENISKLFYTYKHLQIEQIFSNLQFCLRKKSTEKITVAQLKDSNHIEKLIQHDDGFKIIQPIRSSPSFWEKKKSELLSMVRQLGCPSFFLTFSAAETRWSELIVILGQTILKKK